jgi:phosphoenolpyruvate---glycerone phosphotransferase subunit DhaL
MDYLGSKEIQELFTLLAEVMNSQKEELCRLDAQMGDGDLGLTMSRGFTEASLGISELTGDPGMLLKQAGMIMAGKAPSTMGTLMASGFMRGGTEVTGISELRAEDYASFLRAFGEALIRRGKAKIGDKTLLDVMLPAAEAAETAAASAASLSEAASAAAAAGIDGLERTKEMISAHGKAAVFREQSLGKEDPGAAAACLFLQTVHDYVHSRET